MQKEAASEARLCTSPAVETAQSGTRFGRGGLTRINRNQSQPIAIYRNQWLGCGGLGRAGLAGRTSCDEMNSQMPSEATMTNLSPSLPAAGHGLIVNSFTSGSGMTPCALASPSPSERDMARPTRPLTQTREGGRPRGPAAETTPPAASMRLRSRGKSGLWSLLKSSASILPFFTCEARRGKWVGKHGQKTARSRQAQVQAQAQAQVQVTQVAGVSCGRATYLPHHGARVAGARGPQLVSLEVEYVGRGARAARDRANRRVAKQNLIHLDNLRMCQPGGAMRERGRERERERVCVCERERERGTERDDRPVLAGDGGCHARTQLTALAATGPATGPATAAAMDVQCSGCWRQRCGGRGRSDCTGHCRCGGRTGRTSCTGCTGCGGGAWLSRAG